MINFLTAKKNDIIYEAHPNGVLTLQVQEYYKKEKYLSTYLGHDDGFFGGVCSFDESDNKNLFYTKKEARERRQNLPKEMIEKLSDDNKWIKDLFSEYSKNNPKAYCEVMRKTIRLKTGVKVQ
jgi:hypothetical protein